MKTDIVVDVLGTYRCHTNAWRTLAALGIFLTLKGNIWPERVPSSILKYIGRPDWVFENPEHMKEAAIALLNIPEASRQAFRQMRKEFIIGNGENNLERQIRDFEIGRAHV